MLGMFSEPAANVAQLLLQPNETVADLGAGSGAYTIECAKSLKGTGRVYAIEIQKDLLTRIQNSAKDAHLGNVAVIWGHLEKRGGTKLTDNMVDVAILSNVLFQTEDKDTVLEETRRILRPGGRLLFIDWIASFGNLGPHADQVFPEDAARKLLEKHGFLFDKAINAGSYHYGLICRKGGPSFNTVR